MMNAPPWWKLAPWQIATLLLGVLCTAAFLVRPGEDIGLAPIFLHLFYVLDRPASLLALGVAVAAVFVVDGSGRLQAFLRWPAAHPGWLATGAFVGAALGAWFVYHAHPLSMDEYAPRLQSEIFAAGRLTGQIPPMLADAAIPSWFQGLFLHISHETGAIASAYWPGLALVMAPFSLLGAPWLCNPVLTGLTLFGLARLLEALVEDPTARGSALLATVASPVILINGMSFYGMPLQLLCTVMFTLGLVRGTPRQLMAAGAWAALGMTAVNPVPFILYALPWLVWILVRAPGRWRPLGWLALSGLPLALLLGVGWKVLLLENFGNPQAGQLGSNIESMLGMFQAPTPAVLAARAIALVKLYVWAVPGLAVLAALAFINREKRAWSWVFAASALLTLVGYLFVPFDQGHGWGYRYFHAAWLTLPVLAAIALQRLAADPGGRQRAYGFVLAACLGTLALSLPLRAIQVESFIGAHLRQIPARVEGGGRQVVFIDVECGDYTADLVQNDPLFRSNEIRLVSNGYPWDAKLAVLLGPRPRVVANGPCGHRWVLE